MTNRVGATVLGANVGSRVPRSTRGADARDNTPRRASPAKPYTSLVAGLFQPHYSSLDDPALDHETALAEHEGPRTLDEIRVVCLRYHVNARLERDGKLIGEMSRAGVFTRAA